MIVLSTSSGPVKFYVSDIDYESHSMSISDPDNCLSEKFLKLYNSSFLPYRFVSNLDEKYSFFNCSSVRKQHLRNEYQIYQESQDMITCPIYATYSQQDIVDLDLLSCTKMFDVNSSIMNSGLKYNIFNLSWPKPNSAECKDKGMKCNWKSNNTKHGIECTDCNHRLKVILSPKPLIFSAIGESTLCFNFKVLFVSSLLFYLFMLGGKCNYSCLTAGSIILGLSTVSFIKIYLHFREKEEDQVRIDKFLEDYRAQKPARFSYSDIKRITSRFKEKLGEGAHGTVFKGKLSSEILVAVKILNNTQGDGKEFITEVEIMGKIHHINVVRLLGFCTEGIHRALVYNFFPKGSLQSFIFSPDNKDRFMGWEKIQQISLGIAKGIEYLHEGCSHPILHSDINPHNVLLDDSFTPKISDFGLAKLCAKNISVVSMTAARGTLGYMTPFLRHNAKTIFHNIAKLISKYV